MTEKEDQVNAKKTELAELNRKCQSVKCDSKIAELIKLAADIGGMLQDMYLEVRQEKHDLEAEVKKLKSVINQLTQ